MNNWYQMRKEEIVAFLKTEAENGLSRREAADRFRQYGENELREKGGKGALRIIWEQVREMLVAILIVAAAVSFFLGEHVDAVVILVIVVLNTAFGFWQEYNAEKAIAALEKLAVPKVHVKRDGGTEEISAREIVPADVVLIE